MAHGRAVSILIAATVAGLPLALVACAPSPPETPNPAAALAAQLTADETTALRLACNAAGSRAATEECHARQARDLALTPRPIQLARLDADDRLHLNAAC